MSSSKLSFFAAAKACKGPQAEDELLLVHEGSILHT